MKKTNPGKTTAAVLVNLGKPLEIIEDINIPKLKPGQILVEIAFAGLCHSQLKEARGDRGNDPYLPHMLGHEGTGVVLDVGEEVKKVVRGDRVILTWLKGDGLDAGGTQFIGPKEEKINAGAVVTFTNHAVVSENRIVKLPPATPMDLAVLYGCALPTGAGIIFNQMDINENSNVVIIGLGGIGLSALIAAKIFHPKQLIAIDIERKKLNLAKELGANHVINATEINPIEAVKDLTNGLGADFVVEASGLTETIEQGFEMARREGGQLIFASHPRTGSKISIDPFELICGKQIRGSWGGGSNPDIDIPKWDALYAEGLFPLEVFLSHTYKLENINKALDDLENRKIVRAMIAVNPALNV